MNKDLIWTFITGFFVTVVAFGFFWLLATNASHQRQNDLRQMELCVQAGGTWVKPNCVNNGFQP